LYVKTSIYVSEACAVSKDKGYYGTQEPIKLLELFFKLPGPPKLAHLALDGFALPLLEPK